VFNNNIRKFLKIYLYNRKDLRKLGYLLQYGVLNSYKLKCYEIHIDFELAFFKDFDLSGFDEIKIK